MHALIERPFHEDVFAFAFLRHWAHAHVRSTGRGSMRMGFAVGFVARKRYQVWNLVAPMTRLQSHFSERE